MLAAATIALTLAACPLVLAQTTPSPSTPAPGASTQPLWYSHQSGEVRASKLIGTTVKNDAGERIGDINEVVLSKDGKVAAVVIGVGGFLGMGEREIALSFESIRLKQDGSNNPVVTVAATKDGLKAAPEWRWSGNGSSTTGKGTPPADKPTK
jgi:sporulation protein YlmC with PRC-barrel domain